MRSRVATQDLEQRKPGSQERQRQTRVPPSSIGPDAPRTCRVSSRQGSGRTGRLPFWIQGCSPGAEDATGFGVRSPRAATLIGRTSSGSARPAPGGALAVVAGPISPWCGRLRSSPAARMCFCRRNRCGPLAKGPVGPVLAAGLQGRVLVSRLTIVSSRRADGCRTLEAHGAQLKRSTLASLGVTDEGGG